jgi:hypothetical protein
LLLTLDLAVALANLPWERLRDDRNLLGKTDVTLRPGGRPDSIYAHFNSEGFDWKNGGGCLVRFTSFVVRPHLFHRNHAGRKYGHASEVNLCSAVLVASSKIWPCLANQGCWAYRTRSRCRRPSFIDANGLPRIQLKIKTFKREDRDQRPPRTQRKTTESSVPYADATTAHAIFFHWHPGAR